MNQPHQANNKSTEFGLSFIKLAIDYPKTVTTLILVFMVIFAAMFPMVQVDTDPENMLAKEEPVRVFHNKMKEVFSLHDMVVVGIVNEEDENGVFNPESLRKIYELTQFAEGLQWPHPEDEEKQVGVILDDMLAPSTVDNIKQGGLGSVQFEWLMAEPPETQEEALQIRDDAMDNPLLRDTLVSEDGKAIALYLPLSQKDLSYKVYSQLKNKITEFSGPEEYYITGLPVAEDTFGVEMFIQMAISAPTAMVLIFILMWFFFRKLILIVSPMIVALVSVIYSMGALIGTGNTVHIMSSMIPIFVMPIAVLDSIHVLSDFFDQYPNYKDRRKTILHVMSHLFTPMLYTSLTSAAGFASLALTPIPPVQVFGIFVAFGVMVAWLLTITFIPAFTMFIKESSLENFGVQTHEGEQKTLIASFLGFVGGFTYRRAKLILTATLIIAVLAGYGISLIQINDNPVKWFTKSHPIRVADKVLNDHFGGTYMAYLQIEPSFAGGNEEMQLLSEEMETAVDSAVDEWKNEISVIEEIAPKAKEIIKQTAQVAEIPQDLADAVSTQMEVEENRAEGERIDAWSEIKAAVDRSSLSLQTFKRPDVLQYINDFQQHLDENVEIVGKTNSVVDLIKKVYKELFEGKEEYYRVPDTIPAVAQCLISFQNSHNPDDLWHLVTPDHKQASIWFQLTSGDNQDMEEVIREVEHYFKDNPPPIDLDFQWFGKTYLNVVWQDKMVSGMLGAFLGSFVVVFLLMTALFSSPLWGILCMLPLTVTIAFIYGLIGFIGKDYDMPVAVLSSLTLGLAIDFAIHFLARGRELFKRYRTWSDTIRPVFSEPARAITRNIIVIAVGFLPLLLAPLVPYQTVGIFIATILAVSGVATLLILPSLVTVLEKWLFREYKNTGVTCNCAICVTITILAVIFIAINLHQFVHIGWTLLTWISVILIPLMAIACSWLSRRTRCRAETKEEKELEKKEINHE